MKFDTTPFIGKFIQEARELIQKLNEHLIVLEKTPGDLNVTRELMRTVHTLKGSSKILRFHTLSRLAHRMEDLLSSMYEGRITITSDLVDVLFTSTDILTQCVGAISQGDAEMVDVTAIEDMLERAEQGEDLSVDAYSSEPEIERSGSVTQARDQDNETVSMPTSPPSESPSTAPESSFHSKISHRAEMIRIDVHRLDNTIRLVTEIAMSHRKAEHELRVLKDLQRIARKHHEHLQQTIRRGERIIFNNQQTDLFQESQQLVTLLDCLFKEHRDEIASLDLVINELHGDVLGMRMLPLSTVFQTFPRAVRDMARDFHKKIDLQIYGEETTLDKKIIERLGSPLIHIVRNCIDHGIEAPKERQETGKSETGHVTIQARQESGHVEIVISDDGRGLQTEKLRQRLVKRGMFSEEQVQQMEESEVHDTIFLPGISTSEIITDISGRGFGMDIVKTDIEQLKGTVVLNSSPGQGTQCILTLPVTLTTLRCLIIAARGSQFAVPIDSIEETLHISHADCIHVVGHDAIRLRNQMIYITPLAEILRLPRFPQQAPEKLFVLIAHSAGKRIGLVVDEIIDEQDVVVKQLPAHMQNLKTVAGATISGDNTLVLILHIPEIVKLVGRTTVTRGDVRETIHPVTRTTILLVEDSVNTAEIERSILEEQGYAVDVVHDGLTALEQVNKASYDLIVTDIEMPGMDGFSLTEHIRSLPNYRHLPIIIVTSLERDADKRRGIQVGADAYITKGDFEQTRLIETIRSLIQVTPGLE